MTTVDPTSRNPANPANPANTGLLAGVRILDCSILGPGALAGFWPTWVPM